jgi:hypothetical protein
MTGEQANHQDKQAPASNTDSRANNDADVQRGTDNTPKEIGGRDGPDPTRFGDWEKAGRCIDF